MPRCLVVYFFLVCWLGPIERALADKKDTILSQKQELEQIQKEVESSRRKLDSLKQEELQVQKRMSEYDQKIATNKKIVSRLNKNLNRLKREVAKAGDQLEASREHLDRTRRRYLGDVRQFYLATHRLKEVFSARPNEQLELSRQVIYLASLANYESGNVARASAYLSQSRENLARLNGEEKKVSHLKKKKETATVLEKSQKSKQQKALEQLRRKKTEEADRILTLRQAAREMERIIAQLEKERERKAPSGRRQQTGPSAFAALQGQLISPLKGKIIVGFGHSVDPITKLKSFSPGVTLKGKAGQKVVAVAAGTIAYVGNLRGYGDFIIIDHDEQYYTTYGGLGKTSVEVEEYVLAGTQLGTAGDNGQVKFELRHGREPLDPVKWIRIDSF